MTAVMFCFIGEHVLIHACKSELKLTWASFEMKVRQQVGSITRPLSSCSKCPAKIGCVVHNPFQPQPAGSLCCQQKHTTQDVVLLRQRPAASTCARLEARKHSLQRTWYRIRAQPAVLKHHLWQCRSAPCPPNFGLFVL